MSSLDDYMKWFSELSFSDKLNVNKRINDQCSVSGLDHNIRRLSWTGYLVEVTDKGIYCEEGEHFVYLWRHSWGDPFYVGSGKGDRWQTKNGRCDEFYRHIDAGDAAVYIILSGVDSKTAHEYERYVSASLSHAGYSLANGDNNTRNRSEREIERMLARCRVTADKELTKRVEKVVFEALNHTPPLVDYRVTERFLRNYGSDYFSRNYIKSEEAPA